MENDKKQTLEEYKEISEYWDTNSFAEHWGDTEAAEFELSPTARRQYLVAIDPALLTRIQSLAQIRGLSTESLINLFLEQHLQTVEV